MSLDAALVLHLLQVTLLRRGDALAAEELRALLDRAPVSSLPALDRLARRVAVPIDDVGLVRPSHAALVVLTMTRSGYTRAEALRLLEPAAVVGDRLSLAAVVLRLDDPQWSVRFRAQQLLTAIVVDVDVHALAAVLPVIDALGERQRADARPVLRLARDRLRRQDVRAAPTQPRDVQRALMRLHGLSDDERASERLAIALAALRDGDLALALAISRVDDVVVRLGLGAAFAVHSAGHIRLRAAALLHDQPAALLTLSVDVRSDVRGAARLQLGDTADEQREHARSAVDDAAADGPGRALLGALASLGEVGRPADFPRIARFLHDERFRVQAEAVRALVGSHASGGLVDYLDVLVDKLCSPSWRVGVEAARGLAWVPALQLPIDELREREPKVHPSVRRLLVPLVGPGKWSC